MHKHRSVVPIKIYPFCHGESFYPSLLSFLFDWWTKRSEIAEEVSMNCTVFTNYVTLSNGQRHVCLIASSIKIINKHIAVMYWFKSARMVSVMLRVVCVFLGCDMPIQLVLSSEYDDWKTISSWTDSQYGLATKCVTFYVWTYRLTHFSTYNLPIQLLFGLTIKHLTTSIIKY